MRINIVRHKGYKEIGMLPRFESCNVRHPLNPGWTLFGVDITNPSLPQDERPINNPIKS